jgi:hypothetical protein
MQYPVENPAESHTEKHGNIISILTAFLSNQLKERQVNSEGFLAMTVRITEFLDFSHRLVF